MEDNTVYIDAQQARDMIRAARHRVFMISVQTVQYKAEDQSRYYTGYGNLEVSRKLLLTKLLHREQGKYYMFSEVVKGQAILRVNDTGRIIFIG